MRRFCVCVVAILAAAMTIGAPIAAYGQRCNPNPGILPIHSTAYGKSYGEWSAAFWQWAYSLPIDHHPLFDTAPANTGQAGRVLFLGGSFAPSVQNPAGVYETVVTRHITVPVGTPLFFPILNAEASRIENNGTTEPELRAAAVAIMDMALTPPRLLSCEIDGRPVRNLFGYRAQSPLFTFGPLPDNNIFESWGYPDTVGQTSPAVSDGIHLLLAPLPVGRHTIHFHAEVPAFNFLLDITYHIKVAPGRH